MLNVGLPSKVLKRNFSFGLLFFAGLLLSVKPVIAGSAQSPSILMAPQSLVLEHDRILMQAEDLARQSGDLGVIGKDLLERLSAHMEKEEMIVYPQLSLLHELAFHAYLPEIEALIRLTEQLKLELPLLAQEHRAIVSLVQRIIAIAASQNQQVYVKFGEDLLIHIQIKEEVTYPAAILVGEMARLMIKAK